MPGTLADHVLDLAAGMPVDKRAYHRRSLNIPRLQALARAYRAGWLDNVLRRVTPLTTYNLEDYVAMADLFVTERAVAERLLAKMSTDLSTFAALSGLAAMPGHVPEELRAHVALYEAIGQVLAGKFGVAVPAPFASARLDAKAQAEMAFVRAFWNTPARPKPRAALMESDPAF
jgi:hypothetical protein